jgi:hypothetical protein
MAICLLGPRLARQRANKKQSNGLMVVDMGRISVLLSDNLEKALRFKTIERFGGRKGDLSRAVEDAVTSWVANEE